MSSPSLPSPSARFSAELEFVQCLASPEYLNFLAQARLLEDPAFMNFLQYLTYWKQPQYARFITYPHCLAFLDLLLTSARFRNEIAMERFRDFVHQQQFFHWQYPEGGRQCEPSEKKEETIL